MCNILSWTETIDVIINTYFGALSFHTNHLETLAETQDL